ncbi:class I SAM-dependent methyltransferase [Flavobacterium sp.]|uniref:class I SAM-dependent methyltransferase n=1 Tax=Flavobacterium sp. TaxID=239 RepID=UPI00286C6AC4|nr:class I SAM-dependent methyltransferase [Flavobacterium sp.]
MKTDFDNAATNYDQTFTNTVIGKLQRNLVYNNLSKILNENNPKTILEINCGTGEDAIWLAKQSINVVATDISSKMIEIAKDKSVLENLTFIQKDINQIVTEFSSKNFDLIFSNFGGLNCLSLSEMSAFFKNAAQILSTKGHLVLVIMPKSTLWEQCYFLIKLNLKNAFRRKKEYAIANVDGEKVITYYYNPKDIVNLAHTNFEVKTIKPIGFFIPPSYLEPFFKNKPKLIWVLNAFEKRIKNWSFLSKYADHYFIVLQKR